MSSATCGGAYSTPNKDKLIRLIVSLINTYQRVAPIQLRKSCRFEPSCSNYMILAIQKYGVNKGIPLGIRRVLKCRYPNDGQDYP